MSTQIPNEWRITLPTGANLPHATLFAAGYLWVGTITNPGTLTRIDPEDSNTSVTITFPPDGQHSWIIDALYIPSKGKVYCLFVNGLSGDRTVVAEVDPTTMATTDVINDSASGHGCADGSFCTDGSFLYISTAVVPEAPASLLVYDISSWSFVTSIALSHGGKDLWFGHNCRYDGTNIFVSSGNTDLSSHLAFIKVSTSLTILDGASLTAGADTVITDDSAFTTNYVWYGSETTGNVIRVLKSNLSSQTVIHTLVGASCWGVYYDGTFIWSVYETSPGTAVRIDPVTLYLTTFTFQSTPILQDYSNEVLGDGTSLFFAGYTNPGWVSAASQALLDGDISAPIFNPTPSSFPNSQLVFITSTSGASIRYTTDGSTPTESHGTVYVDPIAISSTTTLKAMAYFGGTNSAITSGDYTIVATSAQQQQTGLGISVLIPLTNAPNQTVTVNLPINGGSLTLNLRIYYNENGENGNFWVMDVADQYGNLLVASVPLVTGVWPAANILAPYDYLKIGSAYVINSSGGATDIPDASSLGSSFVLIWGPN